MQSFYIFKIGDAYLRYKWLQTSSPYVNLTRAGSHLEVMFTAPYVLSSDIVFDI
jgi:hypothetical protein